MEGNEERIVVLHGFTQEEAGLIMRAVKGSVAAAADAAFAMTTETNLEWRLSALVEHVSEEHREFRKMREAAARTGKD